MVDVVNQGTVEDIDDALWHKDEYGCYNMYVRDAKGREVHAWLMMRPHYCDRGHIQLCVEGIYTDCMDQFPRYFFSFEEADTHTRVFLKWRLFKYRTHPHKISDESPKIVVKGHKDGNIE